MAKYNSAEREYLHQQNVKAIREEFEKELSYQKYPLTRPHPVVPFARPAPEVAKPVRQLDPTLN